MLYNEPIINAIVETSFYKYDSRPGNKTPLLIMSEEHKMTKQDKLVLTITLATIFFGTFGLALIGLIFNLSS